MGSGTILREVIAAAELLDKDFGVTADMWSCPSFTELARDGLDCERWNRLHPEDVVRLVHHVPAAEPPRPAIAATDGFGHPDTRANLRRPFEVDRFHIAHAAIAALAAEGKMTGKDVARAIKQYQFDVVKPNPISI